MRRTLPAPFPPPAAESTLSASVWRARFATWSGSRECRCKELETLHGDGGVIALTPDGQLAWTFNTPGMFRARQREGGKLEVGIYNDEP
jgi:isoaspartyl peptidase/L-asparaginase-like protein (Ntn-hydrolase superfamily)